MYATFIKDDNGVELHTIPLFHANGWGRPQTSTMAGLKQVMVRRFEPSGVMKLIQDERATTMSLVPTMANSLLIALTSASTTPPALRRSMSAARRRRRN